MLLQKLSVGLEGRGLVGTDIKTVVIEENVMHVLREQLLFGARRLWPGSGRRGDGDARGIFLRSSRTFGEQAISGGIFRGDALRAVGLNASDTLNADLGGVISPPGKSGGLPLLNSIGVRRKGRARGRRRRWRGRRRSNRLLFACAHGHDACERDYERDPLSSAVLHVVLHFFFSLHGPATLLPLLRAVLEEQGCTGAA